MTTERITDGEGKEKEGGGGIREGKGMKIWKKEKKGMERRKTN